MTSGHEWHFKFPFRRTKAAWSQPRGTAGMVTRGGGEGGVMKAQRSGRRASEAVGRSAFTEDGARADSAHATEHIENATTHLR